MNNTQLGQVMVVDDEIDVMTPLCDFLSELGYEVTGCVSAKDALEALKEKVFDLLLIDLVMPEMDGITLLKAAKETDPHLICIIITGKGTIETAVEAMKVGAFDYITKPLDWKLLQPILSRAMEVRRLRKSEEKYRSIVENYQTELICRFMTDGTLTFVNEAYCRYFDRKKEELIGQSFFLLIPDEDKEYVRAKYLSLSLENPVISYEHRVMKPNGEIGWQQWTNRAIFDDNGSLIEFQSVGHDITDRKLAEENLKQSHEQLRALAKRLSETEETERQRLSRELHDRVGQNLTALGINLNMLRNQLSSVMAEEIDLRLTDSMKILEETAKRIRDVMADLRPSVLDDYGLVAAIRWYSDQFSRRTKLDIIVNGEELITRLPSEVEITLFRIAQEVLTNVAKHAMANYVMINLEEVSGIVRLVIIDDGVGFKPADFYLSKERNGWGLLNIQERAEAIGGKLFVKSEPGKGTRIEIEIGR